MRVGRIKDVSMSVIKDEDFSRRLAQNRRARRAEVGKRLGVARREANLSQEVVADALNYSQADVSRIERGRRRLDVVDLENFSVLYGRGLDFFSTWRTEVARTAAEGRQVLSADEFQNRAEDAKIKRGRRWKRYKDSRL
jgi:transcriptional regulator with XRE-family HTH domain